MPVYLGIDWSQAKHDAAFLNEAGTLVAQLTLSHRPEGFLQLDATRQQLGVEAPECLVGLETAHNLLVDFLWDRDYTQIYVLPPKMVQRSRERYRQSGARSDPSDAFVIADILRTDRNRLQPWSRDTLLTRRIRAKVSLIHHLTESSVRLSNRLQAVLARYYPLALHVFSEPTGQIGLYFLETYPTPQEAAELTLETFQDFGRRHRYTRRDALARSFGRLQAPYPEASPEISQIYRQEAVLLAGLLLELTQAKKAAMRGLRDLFRQHPDAAVFGSLPGAGDLLAPSLLAKFGDDRRRFASPASVQALAGTCPVTRSSGKRRTVNFRYACDQELRQVAVQWARCSLRESAWANAYFESVRPHCRTQSHAFRCLANRWLAIAWKLWQTGERYDDGYHLRQRALRSLPRT
ncbi:MAG: IS110 family transposase [Anaerolineales bacterium]|jgi:transposase